MMYLMVWFVTFKLKPLQVRVNKFSWKRKRVRINAISFCFSLLEELVEKVYYSKVSSFNAGSFGPMEMRERQTPPHQNQRQRFHSPISGGNLNMPSSLISIRTQWHVRMYKLLFRSSDFPKAVSLWLIV